HLVERKVVIAFRQIHCLNSTLWPVLFINLMDIDAQNRPLSFMAIKKLQQGVGDSKQMKNRFACQPYRA
ncbi:MAG: hypothetical protein WAR39_06825, partial [Prevotella sp.]